MLLKKVIYLAILLSLIFHPGQGHAKGRIDELIALDTEARIQEIYDLHKTLDAAIAELNYFKAELLKAGIQAQETGGAKMRFRNASLCAAAIGFIGTVVYQSKGFNPSKMILVGGYGLSTLAHIAGSLEEKKMYLTKAEISRLTVSIHDLQKRARVEKGNLEKEMRFLCKKVGCI